MTVQTAFWSWQDRPLQPDPRRCSPICTTWSRYLRDTWGGQDLGCYASRPVTGGSSPSTHWSGAATDWRYQDPGPGRTFMLDTIMPWLIWNSLELGVQAIHDYVGCRIWRPPGTSGRPAQPSPDSGWRQQTPGSQMGQSWALWLHVECLNTRWSDARSVDDMLGAGDRPDPEPEPEPEEFMASMLVSSDDGAVFAWDGQQISWVRSGEEITAGIAAKVYSGQPVFMERPILQALLDSNVFRGSVTPPSWTAPGVPMIGG